MPELTEFVFYFFDHERLPPRRNCLETLISAASCWLAEPSEAYRLNWANGVERSGSWADDTLISAPLSETEGLNVYCASTADPDAVCPVQVVEAHGRAVYSIGVPASQVAGIDEAEVERRIRVLYQAARRLSCVFVCVGSEITVDPHYADPATLLAFASGPLRSDWIAMDEPELLPVTGYESLREPDGDVLLWKLRSPAASRLVAGSTSDQDAC
jgi:hypothetical protein